MNQNTYPEQSPLPTFTGVTKAVWDFGELVLRNRTARALERGATLYPVYRDLHFAARMETVALLDAIALDPAWRAERLNADALLLLADGLYVAGFATRKADYCSCLFYIYAASVARAEEAKEQLLAKAGAARITEPMFTVDWYFGGTMGGTDVASIEEIANDVLRDGAYPEIRGGVHDFVRRYLEAPETVLVLQGPPGTGKTRLIRGILGAMSRRKGEQARALYTGDALVVEDADHLLKPRADGNENLHRFLTIADGVVRAQGRKVIFSTNLPNVGDLDDALLRPGRCFAHIHVRKLTGAEAKTLAQELAGEDAAKLTRAALAFAAEEDKKRSLAEVYGALR